MIILPGITESSRTRYVKWFAMKLRKDFKILVFCRPGTGNSPIHTPRVFLNPRIETVVAMMDNVWNKFNKGPEKRKLFAAGFSMGGQNVVFAFLFLPHFSHKSSHLQKNPKKTGSI